MKQIWVWVLFLVSITVTAQDYKLEDAVFILSDKNADLLYPSWSQDGNLLFYQTNKNGNWDIYAYDIAGDSSIAMATTPNDEQHPAWWPGHNGVAFDKTMEGNSFLYYYNLRKQTTSPLFRRTLPCKHPSFDPQGNLVTFSGFDRETNHWQIFTYDFIYDNLNRLTKQKKTAIYPVFSPKGKTILYQIVRHPNDSTGLLFLINWYGEPLSSYETVPALKTAFTPDEWRIVYVSIHRNGAVMQSMRKDGTAVYQLTEKKKNICCPAYSPEGSKLAVAIKQERRYRIYIFNTKK